MTNEPAESKVRIAEKLISVAACLSLFACGPKVFVLNTTGAGQALSRVTSDEIAEFRPALSPDGTTLLFDTYSSNDRTVVSVDPATGGRRTIYTSTSSQSSEVAWAPTGDWFVYTTNSPGAWSLVRALSRSPNAAVAVLVSGEVAPSISDPSVSPDGGKVTFATAIRGSWHVATADVDGSNFTLLGEGVDPEWSPDGQSIVFSRRVNDWWQIFTVDAARGVEVVQVTSGESDNIDPSWSPDGESIVFSSNRSARKARKSGDDLDLNSLEGPFNLFLLRPDGTGLVQLTDGDGIAVHPHWGSDGRIYFSSNQAGNFDIWRFTLGNIR